MPLPVALLQVLDHPWFSHVNFDWELLRQKRCVVVVAVAVAVAVAVVVVVRRATTRSVPLWSLVYSGLQFVLPC